MVPTRWVDLHAVEVRFPRRDRGQRDCGRLREVHRLRFERHDALVNEMQLAVGAGARNVARIVDLVATPKQRDLRPDRCDRSCRVPAQHSWLCLDPTACYALLGIYRVHRNCGHAHHDVLSGRDRIGQRYIDERLRVGDRQMANEGDGFHERFL